MSNCLCAVCGSSLAECERGKHSISSANALRYCSDECQHKYHSRRYYRENREQISMKRKAQRRGQIPVAITNKRTTKERLMEKVEKQADGCWLWIGAADRYGRMRVGIKSLGAHVVSYRIFKGEIPDGHEIDHVCRNKLCVNPDHLRVVPHRTNVRYAHDREPDAHGNVTCPRCQNVYTLSDHPRGSCPECVKLNGRTYYRRNREKVLENVQRWKERNPDRERQRQRDYYLRNREKKLAYRAQRYAESKAK